MTEPHLENPYKSTVQEDPLQDAMEYRDHFEDEEEFQEALAIWPVCPQCGRRRITTCPICHTAGTLFPLADAEYWVDENNSTATASKSEECHCGNACCNHTSNNSDSLPSLVLDNNQSSQLDLSVTSSIFAPYITGQANEAPAINMNLSAEEQESAKALPGQKEIKLLACYVCSEPFVPRFPARCEWCGHRFESADGVDDSLTEDLSIEDDENNSMELSNTHREEISPRILLVLVGLAVLSLGAIIYLFALFG